jgi:hypothetical protein
MFRHAVSRRLELHPFWLEAFGTMSFPFRVQVAVSGCTNMVRLLSARSPAQFRRPPRRGYVASHRKRPRTSACLTTETPSSTIEKL